MNNKKHLFDAMQEARIAANAASKAAAQTPAQRVTATKARKLAAGLREIRSLWAHPSDIPAIRAYAAKLAEKRKDQT
jgi:hypothetical protein